MDRLLQGFPTTHRWRYTFDPQFRQYPYLTMTTIEINEHTAATNAFVYACWLGDLDVVRQIVQDLSEILYINNQVLGKTAIEWAASSIHKDCLGSDASRVCRYLINHFKSEINANPHSALVLRACAEYGHVDIIAYLVTTYGSRLSHNRNTFNIFALLVKNNYETEAERYMQLFHDHLAQDAYERVLLPLVHGSMHMFQTALDIFGSSVNPHQANSLLSALCETYSHDKLSLVLDVYADHIVPEPHLIKESHSPMSQLIAVRYVDQLKDDGIQVTLTLSCLPQNLDLMDAVFDRYQDKINGDPKLVHHALLECLSLGDIDTFTHILDRCGPIIYLAAFEFACGAGDLGAVSLLFELGSSEIASAVPNALVSACIWGDTDMADLLIIYTGDSIEELFYRKAFRGACYHNHQDAVIAMSTYRNRIDYRQDSDYDLVLVNVEPDIIDLLNLIFGTAIDPAAGTSYSSTYTMGKRLKGFQVQYGGTVIQYQT